MTKRIDVAALPVHSGTFYPPPYHTPCLARFRKRLGDAAGLTQYGVNLTRLAPGSWSSQRHWHSHEDEFIYVLEGELVLVTETGEEIMRAGDCAGFKAGDEDGHHLQNRSNKEAIYLEIGSRHQAEDSAQYPGIDLAYPAGGVPVRFTRRDGTPYEDIRHRGPDDTD
jgi:uncharacterized cupin superfamily protein